MEDPVTTADTGAAAIRRLRLAELSREWVGAAAIVAYGLLYIAWRIAGWGGPDAETFINDLVFIPAGVVATATAFLAARRATTPAARRAWRLFGLAFALYCAGDVTWFWLADLAGGTLPFPSLADIGYLGWYPFLLLGLIAIPRIRTEGRLRELLDLAIVAVGSATIVWFVVIEPVVQAGADDAAQMLVAVAYPVGDLLTLFALAALFMSRITGTSRTALILFGVGVGLNAVADLAYARLALDSAYTSGAPIDVAYMVGWLALALAGLAQASRRIARPARVGPAEPHRAITFLPYVAVALLYAALVAATFSQSSSQPSLVVGAMLVTLLVVIRQAVTARENARLLRDQAFRDPLTGLPNRALMADRIDHALRRSERGERRPALLYLDVDDFKAINDTLGHPAGDRVLVEIAHRLTSCLRPADSAARLGGDEFAILIEDTSSMAEATAVADRLGLALARPLDLGGRPVSIRASMGIVRFDSADVTGQNMIRDADIAMYEAKRNARGAYRIFEPAMFDATVDRVRLETDLADALQQGQLEVFFQPLVNLASGGVTGVEALLRWNHPTRGLILPDDFIGIAERTGEIIPIGRWVIEEACRVVGRWNTTGTGPMRANVNVSACQLEPPFVDDVARILGRFGFDPHLLVLEITESSFSAERPHARQVLDDLRALGVAISIDDFGTGYSALSVLRELPVDELKIDQSFVRALSEGHSGAVVAAIVQLGRDLDLRVVAEGIELGVQAALVRGLGCDVGQGFILGRPDRAAVVEERILADRARAASTLARAPSTKQAQRSPAVG